MVTGNVLNDTSDPKDLILACGSVLKQGGRCIHLLHYGPANCCPVEEVSNLQNYNAAGQKLLGNPLERSSSLPDKIEFPAYDTNALMLEQAQEIDLTISTLNTAPASISTTKELHGRVQGTPPQIKQGGSGQTCG